MLIAALFVLELGRAGLHVAKAETRPPVNEIMQSFFQLGLPDTRGAKWVTAYGERVPMGGSMQQTVSMRGNAWLVREESDGAVELVVGQCQWLRARRNDESTAREGGAADSLPRIEVQPADLNNDMDTLAAAVAKGGGSEAGGNGDYQQEQKAEAAGQTLLFLAQLQRQGHGDFVSKVLPGVLALAPSREMALNAAVSLVADGRLAQLSDDWGARGNAAAFAKEIDALAAEFSRGWNHRDAALLLAKRIRTQAPAAEANDPVTKKAAALLLTLKPEQVRELPIQHNWMLPGSSSAGGFRSFPMTEEGPSEEDNSALADSGTAPRNAFAAFFSGKQTAVAALAHLLGDHRLLRVPRDSNQSRSYFYGEETREELLKNAYEQIPRPYEMGEFAAVLLEPVLPESLRSYGEPPETGQVLAWLAGVANLNDEQLAWDYLRRSSNTCDESFRSSLEYLVVHGGTEMLDKLRDVFLDPAVWQRGFDDWMLMDLDRFLKRLTGDTSGFREKLGVAYKSAIEEEHATQMNNGGMSMDEATKKALASQEEAQIKKLDQILKPQASRDLLAQIVAAPDLEAATPILATVQLALAKAPRTEAETQLFETAAKTRNPAVKQQLLTMLQQLNWRGWNRAPSRQAVPATLPDDPALREALLDLLNDETKAEPGESEGTDVPSMAESTAVALVWPRLRPGEEPAWRAMFMSAPEIASSFIKQYARALATGQPPPPRPDASRVPAEETKKILGKIAALPAEEVSSAFRANTLDQQLALTEYLGTLPQWPMSLVTAHFTITEVQTSGSAAFAGLSVGYWKGRRLDDAAYNELVENGTKAGRDGHGIKAEITSNGPVSGLKLSIQRCEQTLESEQLRQVGLPDFADKPSAAAVAALSLETGSQSAPAGYFFPIWKDRAVDPPKKLPGPVNGQPNDPGPYNERLKALLALDPKVRDSFRLTLQVMIIRKTSNADLPPPPVPPPF